MRILKIVLITLILSGLAIPLLSCGSESDSESLPENQVVTVQRGDLMIDITASGNLALSLKEDIAFEISGTVEEIMVEEGDSVEEGQVLAKLDTSEWDDELRKLERELLQADINLENAKFALNQAEMADVVDDWQVEIKELRVELAETLFEDARKALEEALEDGPEITAPFDGFITKVNVDGGDEVTKGTVAVQLADPNKFEADILVSEMDIFQVKLGGEAWVQVDALQGMSLPAEVTHISPTATIQQGVVNYKVKVELQPLEEVTQERQEARQEAMEKIEQGGFPERLQQAIEEGLITQQQAEEIMKEMQQGQGGQQGQMPKMISEDFQLREGLTVTVSIIVDEREDVLLVPNNAIIRSGRETFVQVLKDNNVVEPRSIKTGISNWQYTEVIEGLSEGEKVVVPQGTATTTTTPEQKKPPGGMMIPGMGKPR